MYNIIFIYTWRTKKRKCVVADDRLNCQFLQSHTETLKLRGGRAVSPLARDASAVVKSACGFLGFVSAVSLCPAALAVLNLLSHPPSLCHSALQQTSADPFPVCTQKSKCGLSFNFN